MRSSLLVAAVCMQAAHAIDDVDEIFEVKEDPRLDNNWPRYYMTDFTAIRKGATENNSQGGFWLDGTYSTVENLLGDLDFEMEMVLHNPKQEENFVYQVWFQIVDATMSNKQRKSYEGYSAAVRYLPDVLD